MADQVQFQIVNERALKRALNLAPKRVVGAIRRKFVQGEKRFSRQVGKELYSGPPGIFLPKSEFSAKGKLNKGSAKTAKARRAAHAKGKVVGKKLSLVWVSYLSKFSTFHEKRLEPIFTKLFRQHAKKIEATVEGEVARITQAVLDKNLRDTGTRF